MAGSAHDGRRLVWQERLQRFESSGLSVGRFCAQEGVSAPSFYYWRKKLGQESSLRTSRRKASAFRPVRVTPAAVGLSVELPGGTRIEVGNPDLVRTVIRELLQAEQVLGAGDAGC